MIIRKTPKNFNNYYIVNSDINVILHTNGFIPMYMSEGGNYYYYVKTEKIKDFIQKNNLTVLDL